MSTGKWAWNVREGDLVACAARHGHIRGTVVEAAPEIGVVWIRDNIYGERRMLMMQDLVPDTPTRGVAVPLSQFRAS
ncbi:hypothetical protein [Pseudarthrobacter sp. WHRI 8279]|jgi:hypothetical protein|uniref:hypothetical protein n=1 Tax=Pseudarthrobacter sp. WHRI 8279 TaxID=3162566 RepID=UPI0032EE6C1E